MAQKHPEPENCCIGYIKARLVTIPYIHLCILSIKFFVKNENRYSVK
jgi:hypothetical protein